jgi:hypothetical protein
MLAGSRRVQASLWNDRYRAGPIPIGQTFAAYATKSAARSLVPYSRLTTMTSSPSKANVMRQFPETVMAHWPFLSPLSGCKACSGKGGSGVRGQALAHCCVKVLFDQGTPVPLRESRLSLLSTTSWPRIRLRVADIKLAIDQAAASGFFEVLIPHAK